MKHLLYFIFIWKILPPNVTLRTPKIKRETLMIFPNTFNTEWYFKVSLITTWSSLRNFCVPLSRRSRFISVRQRSISSWTACSRNTTGLLVPYRWRRIDHRGERAESPGIQRDSRLFRLCSDRRRNSRYSLNFAQSFAWLASIKLKLSQLPR